MNQKLIIPTPEPAAFDQQRVGVGGAVPAHELIYKVPKTPAEQAIERFLQLQGPPPPPQQRVLPVPPVGSLAGVPSFIPKVVPQPVQGGQRYAVPTPAPDATPAVGNDTTLNGKPILANLEIEGFNWTTFDQKTTGFNAMTFKTVLISAVQQQKNIVETQIQGSDTGSVFEYSGMNSYEVTINIIITTGTNGAYPQDGVEQLLRALICPYPIKVQSWYLQMFDIHELVIKDYDIGQAEGGISQQSVTIHARSNTNAVLIIQ